MLILRRQLSIMLLTALMSGLVTPSYAVSHTVKKGKNASSVPVHILIASTVPNPNPAVPAGLPTSSRLTGTLFGTDSIGNPCVITSQTWTWTLDSKYPVTYSNDGKNFSAPDGTMVAPTFSLSPANSAANTVSLVATTKAATTPGYWRVTVNASAQYVSNCGSGPAEDDRAVVFAVGTGNKVDFSVTITPAQKDVPQGTGTTVNVTVTSLHGFSGDVTLSLSGNPSGSDYSFYIYDSVNHVGTVSTDTNPTLDVPLESNSSQRVCLTICMMMATQSQTPYNLTVTGQSGTQGQTGFLSHNKPLA